MPQPVPTAVRLRVEPLVAGRPPGGMLETCAIVNTGYRSMQRELMLPAEAARCLGYWPELPAMAVPLEVDGISGKAKVWGVPEAVRVRVVTPDREGPAVVGGVLINPGYDEILISNALAGGLGLVLLDPERGLWRFRDDPPDRERQSEPPRFW